MKTFLGNIFNPEQPPSSDDLSAAHRRYWTEFMGAENFTRRILQDFGPNLLNDAPAVPKTTAEAVDLIPKRAPEQFKVVDLMGQQEQAEEQQRQQHQDKSRADVAAAFEQPIQLINERDAA